MTDLYDTEPPDSFVPTLTDIGKALAGLVAAALGLLVWRCWR